MDINKAKCKKLKQIRKAISDKIGVELHQTECTYEGKCSGTCPKCQQEESILNKALLSKGAAAVATVAIAAGLTGCSADFDMKQLMANMKNNTPKESEITLEGEVAYNPDDYIELEGDVAIEDMTEQSQ